LELQANYVRRRLTGEETAQQVADWFSSLPPERFRNIVAMAEPLLDGDTTRRFSFGLNALLDGLEARLLPGGT